MASPRNTKEVQRLVEGLLPCPSSYNTRRRGVYPSSRSYAEPPSFPWDEKCEQAFMELKQYLTKLPVLAKPVSHEPLWVYLSAFEEALGHILKDAELRYSSLEKLALALTLMAHKLRPYFLSHPIIVLTNSNLGRVLLNPDSSGRLVKWTIELSEYDIQYQPRISHQSTSPGRLLDGSNRAGCSRESATNNEAEYEAVLAGLQAARHLGALRVIIHSDSQLVDQQTKGTFEVHNDCLKRYAKAVEKLKSEFQEVMLQKIPRADNQRADDLAKLASSLSTWELEEPTIQELLIAQVDQMPRADEPADWRTPILAFLKQEVLPDDQEQARMVKRRAARFVLIGDTLYKRAFSRPLLKCLGSDEADYVLREIHRDVVATIPEDGL
ncbi:uncharacterized protein LOC141830566 [Curcuma longa]|uniref:uncharacterized protein LOC141830566 n=1 Tax=Curcuma longa TaxID=136217 RepID=UPI003D9DB3B0